MATATLSNIKTSGKEIEILEFILGEQSFGVSVLKIEAIEQYRLENVTVIPTLPPGVIGTLLFRRVTVPLVDLRVELGVRFSEPDTQLDGDDKASDEAARNQIVLVVNFSNTTVAFLADGVNRIHRTPISEISPMNVVFDQDDSKFTGSFNVDHREILIVDMEKLVSQVVPSAGSNLQNEEQIHHPKEHLRSNVKIILVEDSSTTRSLIKDVLAKGRYTNVQAYRDGKAGYDAITEMKEKADKQGVDISEFVDLVISDIEMPQMDGLTLCSYIKNTLGLKVPVIMYSTRCNSEEEMTASEKNAHADVFIPKPQIIKLVETLDRLTIDAQD